jgi:hypothetical protein
MKLFTLHKTLMKRVYLHRGLVILLLILISADLALPQRCCNDLECGAEVGLVASAGVAEGLALAGPEDSQGKHHSESKLAENGCFCCCAHIIQSNVFSADIPVVKWRQTAPAASSLPLSPPRDKFHPPRSA